ncbi:MAG: hypothetical protein QOJ35_2777 [Solirubrobacteraceae bacterium]|nr:hypothetical protein [Solirubrobacteraceae bacterium]
MNRGTAKIRLKGPIAHRCKGEPAVVLAEALQRRAATSTRPSAGASERAPAGFSGRRLGGCAGRVFRVVAGRGGWSRTRRSCRRGSDREGLQAIRERMAELAPAAERRGPPTGARLCTYSPAVQYSSISKFRVSGSQLTGYRATFDASGNCQAYETRPSPYGGSFYTGRSHFTIVDHAERTARHHRDRQARRRPRRRAPGGRHRRRPPRALGGIGEPGRFAGKWWPEHWRNSNRAHDDLAGR